MMDVPVKNKKILIIVFIVTLIWFWQMMFAFMVVSVLVVLAYGFIGKKTGTTVLLLSFMLLLSAQLHWMGGNTICLSDARHPYLWQMQRTDAKNVDGSIKANDDGSTSIRFSAKSDDLIPGVNYAEIIAGNDASITSFRFLKAPNTPSDVQYISDIQIPTPLVGNSLFVPSRAQFRANRGFDNNTRTFDVADLPVLIEIKKGVFSPLGILQGNITLGDTAVPQPANFDGRNLVLDADKRRSAFESNLQYFEDKRANPEIIVDKMQKDWLMMRSPSHLYLHKYAQAYDCRPQAYETLGIGWLFSSK